MGAGVRTQGEPMSRRLATLLLALTLSACTPTGQAVRRGVLTAFLIAQAKYCEQPEEARLIVRGHLEAKGIKVEIDCDKGEKHGD